MITAPDIRYCPERIIVGHKLNMSYVNNRTAELWRTFMPRRREVGLAVGEDLFSVQIYPSDFFSVFSPVRSFEKWAAVEVTDNTAIPAGMHSIAIPGGLYAVFHFRGPSSQGREVFQYIFEAWLPVSGYVLDDRPHFELLGPAYKNEDPSSEEDFWIPVRSV